MYQYTTIKADAADVLTSTGIGDLITIDAAGVLDVRKCFARVSTLLATDTIAPILSLQLVRSATTYTLGTITFAEADAVGKQRHVAPSTSVTLPGDNQATNLDGDPFVTLQSGDTVQWNVTTAGTDSGAAAGAYFGFFVIQDAVQATSTES